jgi:hypothetical protein
MKPVEPGFSGARLIMRWVNINRATAQSKEKDHVS